jgi:hypothetical protein
MRIQTTTLGPNNEIRGYTLWLSKSDTENWADDPHKQWPCSTTRGKAIVVEVDSNGLCGGKNLDNIDAHELNAIVSDHLPKKYQHLWPINKA